MAKKWSVGYLCAVAGLSLAGCTMETEQAASQGTSEPVAEEAAAISTCSCNNSSYTVTNITNATFEGPTRSAHMCWPTRYDRQNTQSPDAEPDLIVEDDGTGNWRFTGSGEISCVERCCFQGTQSGWTRTLTAPTELSATTSDPTSFVPRFTNLQSNSLQFLTGIRHTSSPGFPFHTGMITNEYAQVNLNDSLQFQVVAGTQCTLFICPTVTTSAVAYSLFVGVLGTAPAVTARTFTLTPSVPTALNMMSASTGVCTISDVHAAAGGTTPAVTLTRPSGAWRADLGSGVGSATITCYNYIQPG